MKTTKTYVQSFVEEHFSKRGETVFLAVICREGQGLPSSFLENKHPIMFNMLGGRPLNVLFENDTISMDLCFSGPPQTCTFKWEDIIAIGLDAKAMYPCTAVAALVRTEDDGVLLGDMELDATGMWETNLSEVQEEPKAKKPSLSLVDG